MDVKTLGKNIEKLHKYAMLKSKIATAEQELEQLKPEIMKIMGNQDTIENGFGKFSKVITTKYRFTTELEDWEAERKAEIKNRKQIEIDKGLARAETETILRYDFPNAKVK